MSTPFFQDRHDAGRQLARLFGPEDIDQNAAVLALPRGGIPIGAAIAQTWNTTLGVVQVRKLGVPSQPELAFGAIAKVNGDIARITSEALVQSLHLSSQMIEKVESSERRELLKRDQQYRLFVPQIDLHNKQVILTDDGLATGATMQAAIAAVHRQKPAQIIAAVPVAAPQAVEKISALCDKVLYLSAPADFGAVGSYYQHFEAPDEAEIREAFLP